MLGSPRLQYSLPKRDRIHHIKNPKFTMHRLLISLPSGNIVRIVWTCKPGSPGDAAVGVSSRTGQLYRRSPFCEWRIPNISHSPAPSTMTALGNGALHGRRDTAYQRARSPPSLLSSIDHQVYSFSLSVFRSPVLMEGSSRLDADSCSSSSNAAPGSRHIVSTTIHFLLVGSS